MNKSQYDLMLKGADFIENVVPDNKFNMKFWAGFVEPMAFSTGYVLQKDDEYVSIDQLNTQCNTAGCAIGWMATMPEFIEAGLELDLGEPRFMDYTGFKAAAIFFGITQSDAYQIFDPANYRPDYLTNTITRLEAATALRETAEKYREFLAE